MWFLVFWSFVKGSKRNVMWYFRPSNDEIAGASVPLLYIVSTLQVHLFFLFLSCVCCKHLTFLLLLFLLA